MCVTNVISFYRLWPKCIKKIQNICKKWKCSFSISDLNQDICYGNMRVYLKKCYVPHVFPRPGRSLNRSWSLLSSTSYRQLIYILCSLLISNSEFLSLRSYVVKRLMPKAFQVLLNSLCI